MTNPTSDAQRPTVFEGMRLIVGDGTAPIDDAVLVVRDGVVEQSGPAREVEATADLERVSLAGRTVMPALLNVHGHIGYMDVKSGVTGSEHYSRENVLDHLRRLAYYGVSVFQSLGTERDGVERTIRDEQRSGALDDPELAILMTAGTGIIAPTPGEDNAGPFFACDVLHEARTVDEARATVREVVATKPDIVKLWVDTRNHTKASFTSDLYAAVIDEAHRGGLRAVAHIFYLDDAKGVVRAGANGIAHQVREAPGPDDELLELLKRHDVFACTSMGIEKSFSSDPVWMDDPALAETVPAEVVEAWKASVAGLPPERVERMRAQYAVIEHSLRRYRETGVKAILSADTGLYSQAPGFAEHRELEAMVDAGMPVLEAIRAGTEIPAEVLRLPERGALRPGKRADFIVLQADPMDDIRNTRRIEAVHFRGRAIDRQRLAEAWGTGTALSGSRS